MTPHSSHWYTCRICVNWYLADILTIFTNLAHPSWMSDPAWGVEEHPQLNLMTSLTSAFPICQNPFLVLGGQGTFSGLSIYMKALIQDDQPNLHVLLLTYSWKSQIPDGQPEPEKCHIYITQKSLTLKFNLPNGTPFLAKNFTGICHNIYLPSSSSTRGSPRFLIFKSWVQLSPIRYSTALDPKAKNSGLVYKAGLPFSIDIFLLPL